MTNLKDLLTHIWGGSAHSWFDSILTAGDRVHFKIIWNQRSSKEKNIKVHMRANCWYVIGQRFNIWKSYFGDYNSQNAPEFLESGINGVYIFSAETFLAPTGVQMGRLDLSPLFPRY